MAHRWHQQLQYDRIGDPGGLRPWVSMARAPCLARSRQPDAGFAGDHGQATKFGDCPGFVTGLGQTVQGVSQMLGTARAGERQHRRWLASTATSAKFFPWHQQRGVAKNPWLAKVLGSNHLGMRSPPCLLPPASLATCGTGRRPPATSRKSPPIRPTSASVTSPSPWARAPWPHGGPAGPRLPAASGWVESIYLTFGPAGLTDQPGRDGHDHAIVASNGGDRGKTAGMIFDAMVRLARHDPSDGSFAGNVNHRRDGRPERRPARDDHQLRYQQPLWQPAELVDGAGRKWLVARRRSRGQPATSGYADPDPTVTLTRPHPDRHAHPGHYQPLRLTSRRTLRSRPDGRFPQPSGCRPAPPPCAWLPR